MPVILDTKEIEDQGAKPAQANSSWEPILKNSTPKKSWWLVEWLKE
jgi:hypothetical protein